MAAVARFGFGMRWLRAHLRWPVPWASAEWTWAPRRYHQDGSRAHLGIGVTWAFLSFTVALMITLGTMMVDNCKRLQRRMRCRHPANGTPDSVAFVAIGYVSVTLARDNAHYVTTLVRHSPTATTRGPLSCGVEAPLRRYTDLAMWPAMAAVAWFGFGMW